MDTPVLFVTFNRPELTKKVFEKIKLVKPTRLIIASDGPRSAVAGEAQKVEECRAIFTPDNITWDCNVTRLYHDSNQGCARGVSSAINAVFELEEQIIVLEDDVVPHLSFFTFCTLMLEKYKSDSRVMHISGTRWNQEYEMGDADHFFSSIGHIWGWATWKRAWNKYDYNMDNLPQLKKDETIKKLFNNSKVVNFWHSGFDWVNIPNKQTWDIQWQFALFFNQGLAVVPIVNLTSNIGTEGVHYNGEATIHHFQPVIEWVEKPNVIVKVERSIEFDRYHMKDRFLKKPPLRIRVINKVRKLLEKFQ